MKKNMHVIGGILAGILILGSVSAFANTADLEDKAYWNNKVKILFDGNSRIMTGGFLVINYLDYNYTSARFIAEGLGAKVDYDEETKTIKIARPVQEPVYEEMAAEETYLETPLRYEDERLEMTINGVVLGDYPAIYYSVDFASEGYPVAMFDHNNAYMEYEGEKYYADPGFEREDWDGLLSNIKEGKLVFDRFYRGDSDEVKVVIPYFDSKDSPYYGKKIELLLKLPKVVAETD